MVLQASLRRHPFLATGVALRPACRIPTESNGVDYLPRMTSTPQETSGDRVPATALGRRILAPEAAFLGVALLTVLWGWWAWQEGAYDEGVMLPGTVLLGVGSVLLVLSASVRADLRLSKPVAVAIVSLFGLAAWTALSMLWSPTPDVAAVDAIRVTAYALSFCAGLCVANLLGARMQLSIVPLAAAGAFAGLVALVALAGGDAPRELLEDDGTLDFPLGYRNATAAFFAIALFPALGVASSRSFAWPARGAAMGAATLCVSLFLLCQSRGSQPALLLALIAYLLLSPLRVRALAWLVLAVAPALATLPAASSVYTAANDTGLRSAVEEMNAAAIVIAIAALAAVAVGLAAARLDERGLPGLGETGPRGNRLVAIGLGVVALAGGVAFVAAVGDPVDWVGQRVEEFKQGGSPDLSAQRSRFGINASSDRYDLWRVALDDAAEDPLLGDGAGGFELSYLAEREVAYQNARDAHSVELELLSELGLPGLGMLLGALGGIALGVRRAMRLGPSAAALGAVALASGLYWLVHASVDWFWAYPALTAPTFALLGAACAAPLRTTRGERSRVAGAAAIAVAAVVTVASVPLFLADGYIDGALADASEDLEGAYEDLDRARVLNPLSDVPLLAEGFVARQAGDRERAVEAFREAIAKRPEGWAARYLLAGLLARSDPEEARRQAAIALELNPLEDRTRALARRLGLELDGPGDRAD